MTPEEKKALRRTAISVREGILTSTHGAKAGHPGGSLSAADMFTYSNPRNYQGIPAAENQPAQSEGRISEKASAIPCGS